MDLERIRVLVFTGDILSISSCTCIIYVLSRCIIYLELNSMIQEIVLYATQNLRSELNE